MENSRFAEAIEGQLSLLRFCESDKGKRLMHVLMGGPQEKAISWEVTNVMGLSTGQTYYWDPAMCSMLEQVAPDMPDWTLTHSIMPAASGFFWFSKPLTMPILQDKNGTPVTDHLWGMSWISVCRSADGGSFVPIGNSSVEGDAYIALSMYSPIGGTTPVPSVNWSWEFDQTLWDAVRREVEEGLTKTRILRLQYFAAALAFLDQRILTAEPRALDRATRRRMPSTWTHEPLVRVIQLRRRSAGRQLVEDDRETPDWSCQWVVRGHWRQQPYPSRSVVQPKWIMPYVKGPDDKPLKAPRATVFAVVR